MIIALIVVGILLFCFMILSFLLYVGMEARQEALNYTREDNTKLHSQNTHLISQIAKYGYVVERVYSDAVYIKPSNDKEDK